MSNTAADRFRRLTMLLPLFAEQEEQSIKDLVAATGATEAELLQDLRSLSERYDDPAGYAESVGVLIDGETVSVRTNHFRRPMRLTAAELCALELGLAVLQRECSEGEQPRVAALRTRLEQLITKLPQDAAYTGLRDGSLSGGESGGVLQEVRKALVKRCKLELEYHGPVSEAASVRVVQPYSLIFSSGSWYLAGWCERSDSVRMFRTDRIVSANMLADECEPAEFNAADLMVDGKPFGVQAAPAMLQVRYGPAIGRWIAERDGLPLEADGSALRTLPLADREWAVRHVLQYGPDAQVLAPEEIREAVVERLRGVGDR